MDVVVYDKVGKESDRLATLLLGTYPQETITDAAIASFDDGADGIPVKALTVGIEPVQKGTGDPSPDNVRPISGWTGAEISGTGINIWDEEWEQGGISETGGVIADSTKIRSKNYIPVKPGMSVYLKTSNEATYLWLYDKNKTFISASYSAANNVVAIPDNCYFIKLRSGNNSNPVTTYNRDVSINYPAADTAYHPYTGNQISVTFPSEAGIVYGGTIDLLSRKLAVNEIKKVFKGDETLQWTSSYDNGGYVMYTIANLNTVVGDSGICNMLKPVTSNVAHTDWTQHVQNSTAYNRDQIAFRFSSDFQNDNSTETSNMYRAELARLYQAGTPLEVVYMLAEPQTFQLTESEISDILTTLHGTNNIWADTGNIEKLTYRADLGKYIDSHITTAVANALNA